MPGDTRRSQIIPRPTLARLTFEAIAVLSGALLVGPTAVTAIADARRASLLPQLVQLDSALGRHFLSASEAHLIVTANGSVRLQPERGRWPGISLDDVWPDWRGYSALVIDVSNTNTKAFSLLVRIDDRRADPHYRDRYNQHFELAPLSRRVIRIPIADIESAPTGSRMDLSHLQRIILFEDGSSTTYPFYLNSLRLER